MNRPKWEGRAAGEPSGGGEDSSAPCHCGVFLRHQPDIPRFSSIPTLSPWRRHQSPQVKGSVLLACPLSPLSDVNPESRLSPVL